MSRPYTGDSVIYDPNKDVEVFDTFMSLRDTLVYSGKKYSSKSLMKLVIGEKQQTVEVIGREFLNIRFNSSTSFQQPRIIGTYLSFQGSEYTQVPMTVTINKTGRYKIFHKEEVRNIGERVYTCVDVYRKNSSGEYEKINQGGIAAYDYEGENVYKITAFGIIEKDLKNGDLLTIRFEDENGNELTLERDSNYRSIEYIDLYYND